MHKSVVVALEQFPVCGTCVEGVFLFASVVDDVDDVDILTVVVYDVYDVYDFPSLHTHCCC